MREVGIEVGDQQPRMLTPELAATSTLLITMGCGEECPVVPGARRDDWPVPDPKGREIEHVREIRETIRSRVAALVGAEGWGRSS